MKHKIFPVFLVIAGLFFIDGCTESINRVQPTNTPIPTLDPCLPANLPTAVQPVSDLLYAFDDITFVANYTPQVQLTQPILELQSLRRQLDDSTFPVCMDTLKKTTRNYMNSVILYLSYFMGGVEKEKINATLKSSQEIRAMAESEYQKLLGTGIPSFPSVLPSGSDIQQTPQIAVTGSANPIQVKNAGNQAINIRKEANINSAIIGSLQSGEVITGYGRDTTGMWIMVKINAAYGWISAEMVEINPPFESIPEITITPSP